MNIHEKTTGESWGFAKSGLLGKMRMGTFSEVMNYFRESITDWATGRLPMDRFPKVMQKFLCIHHYICTLNK